MQKRMLILNGSFCEIPLIKAAKELGYYVITTGNMPALIGHSYADAYIPADYSDKDAVLKIVQENHIDCIQSCANDFGVLTAAYVAEKMGWLGHDSYDTAMLLHHKDLFKEFTRKHNLPAPLSHPFTDIAVAKEYVRTAKYPLIVKANDLTGGKGILKAENIAEADFAIDNAFARSRAGHIVIEPFIVGTQHTLVTFLVDKKIVSFSSCNCYSPINPYLIQAETFPADEIDLVKEELFHVIEYMAQTLNLADGIIALQYIKKDGKPYIIETMRRPFGNQFLSLVELTSGFPWHKAQLLAENGQDCSHLSAVEPAMKYCGHHGIMATRNGFVKSYHIPAHIEQHIFKKIEMLPSGGMIHDYMNERIAYIYYQYDNKEEMLNAVKKFNDEIKIEFVEENKNVAKN